MLSGVEAERLARGHDLKRYVRAAAALRGLYDDMAISEAVGASRNTVGSWWTGSQPAPDTLERVAEATGLSLPELTAYVYFGGPPPTVADPGSPVVSAVVEGIRRDQDHQRSADGTGPALSPARHPRGTTGALS